MADTQSTVSRVVESRRARSVSQVAGDIALFGLVGLVAPASIGSRTTSAEAAWAVPFMFIYMAAGTVAVVATIIDNYTAYPRSVQMWRVIPVGITSIMCAAAALATAPAAGGYRLFLEGKWDRGTSVLPGLALIGSVLFGALFVFEQGTLEARYEPGALARPLPRVDSLGERVAQAQASLTRTGDSVRATLQATTQSLREALASTTAIVDALEDELRVRRAALDELTAQAQAAETRAGQARDLARIEESTAQALDALLDRRLAERLEALERAGHRWDAKLTLWSQFPNLVIGLVAGYLVAVLLGH
jgi:hypothetical protein